MYLSVDRIEDGYAICEDDKGNASKIGLELLPENVKETDIIKASSCGYVIDGDETIHKKQKNLHFNSGLIFNISCLGSKMLNRLIIYEFML